MVRMIVHFYVHPRRSLAAEAEERKSDTQINVNNGNGAI